MYCDLLPLWPLCTFVLDLWPFLTVTFWLLTLRTFDYVYCDLWPLWPLCICVFVSFILDLWPFWTLTFWLLSLMTFNRCVLWLLTFVYLWRSSLAFYLCDHLPLCTFDLDLWPLDLDFCDLWTFDLDLCDLWPFELWPWPLTTYHRFTIQIYGSYLFTYIYFYS